MSEEIFGKVQASKDYKEPATSKDNTPPVGPYSGESFELLHNVFNRIKSEHHGLTLEVFDAFIGHLKMGYSVRDSIVYAEIEWDI